MPILNFFLQLQTYSDKKANNNPNLVNFKWARDIPGIAVEHPSAQSLTIAASGSVTLLTGASKKMVYVESNGIANLTINSQTIQIKPIVINNSTAPGQFLWTGDVSSLTIANPDTDNDISIFLVTTE